MLKPVPESSWQILLVVGEDYKYSINTLVMIVGKLQEAMAKHHCSMTS